MQHLRLRTSGAEQMLYAYIDVRRQHCEATEEKQSNEMVQKAGDYDVAHLFLCVVICIYTG